jgi:hypothetical protein
MAAGGGWRCDGRQAAGGRDAGAELDKFNVRRLYEGDGVGAQTPCWRGGRHLCFWCVVFRLKREVPNYSGEVAAAG